MENNVGSEEIEEPMTTITMTTATTEIDVVESKDPMQLAYCETEEDVKSAITMLSRLAVNGRKETEEEKTIKEHLATKCEAILKPVQHLKPYYETAALYEDVIVTLDYEDLIGNLFQEGGEDAPVGVLSLRGNVVESIRNRAPFRPQKSKIEGEMAKKDDDGAKDLSSSSSSPFETEYDFEKCHVLKTSMEFYENDFPFNFYWEESNYKNVVGARSANPTLKDERDEDKTNSGLPIEERGPISGSDLSHRYCFSVEASENINREWKRENFSFPHLLYSAEGLQGIRSVMSFGGCHPEDIYTGTVGYDIESVLNDSPSSLESLKTGWIMFRGDHVLCDALLNESERPNRSEETKGAYLFKFNVEKGGGDEGSENKNANDGSQERPYDGLFCKYSIAEKITSVYRSEIKPSLVTSNLKDFTMRLFYYKKGVKTTRYERFLMEEENLGLSLFEEDVFSQKCKLRITLLVSFVVYPKENYETKKTSSKYICADWPGFDIH